MTIFTFHHTIMLGGVRTSELLDYTTFVKLSAKLIRDTLSATIGSDIVHNRVSLGFDHLQEMGEVGKNIRFFWHKVDPGTTSVVIYESDIIAVMR